MKALEKYIRSNGALHATTVFGRRSRGNLTDAELLRRTKTEKEQELIREYPIAADIVGDIIVDFLLINGLYNCERL
jgi:hypothetical protein